MTVNGPDQNQAKIFVTLKCMFIGMLNYVVFKWVQMIGAPEKGLEQEPLGEYGGREVSWVLRITYVGSTQADCV